MIVSSRGIDDNNYVPPNLKLCHMCDYEKEYYTTEKIHSLGDPAFRHAVFHLMKEVQELKEQLRKLQSS